MGLKGPLDIFIDKITSRDIQLKISTMFFFISINIGIWFLVLVPTWIGLIVYCYNDPQDYWQSFSLVALMLVFGGAIQLTLISVGVILTICLFNDVYG